MPSINDTIVTQSPKRFVKIPHVLGLYRDTVSGRYYGAKKLRGKRREISLKTTDRKIAERRLRDWMANLGEINPETERMCLRQLLGKFKAVHQGKSESTRATNQCIIRVFQKTWKYGLNVEVRSIRPSHLDEWLAMHEGRLKNTSYNRYATFLRQLFEIAVKDRVIAESPFEKVETPWKKPQRKIPNIPTTRQFQAIVDSIRSQPLSDHAEDSADFVEFLGLAALGQAEASSLLWKDVDFQRNVLHIRRQKTGVPFTVPIYPHLRPLLERIRVKSRNRHSPGGRVFQIQDAKKALNSACVRLGLPHFSQRNLRQYGIGVLWKAGIDKKYIAKWQGHQDGGELILSTYTEVFGSDDQEYERHQLSKLGSLPNNPVPESLPAPDNNKVSDQGNTAQPERSPHKFSLMEENPFKAGDAVLTLVKKSEQEATVTQVYNREVQIRTADGVLRWRTCKTVWFPRTAGPQPVPVAPLAGPEQSAAAATPVPVEVGPAECQPHQPDVLPIVTRPLPADAIITTCGQEEAEELKRQRGKRARKAYRRRP